MATWTARIVVISGGLSEESSTHRLAQLLSDAVATAASARGGEALVERIDLRAIAHDITTASLTGFAPAALEAAYDAVADADAIIAVTPTYKASYTGLFKSFWDATPDGVLSGVPVVVGATGGTPRHSLVTDTALRPLFAYMKALVMPTAVYAATDDWAGRSLEARASEAADELTRQLQGALGAGVVAESEDSDSDASGDGDASTSSPKSARTLADTRNRARDPFVAVPTMEEMLRG